MHQNSKSFVSPSSSKRGHGTRFDENYVLFASHPSMEVTAIVLGRNFRNLAWAILKLHRQCENAIHDADNGYFGHSYSTQMKQQQHTAVDRTAGGSTRRMVSLWPHHYTSTGCKHTNCRATNCLSIALNSEGLLHKFTPLIGCPSVQVLLTGWLSVQVPPQPIGSLGK